MAGRKMLVPTAQGWFDLARDPSAPMQERLIAMENALNHTENALAATGWPSVGNKPRMDYDQLMSVPSDEWSAFAAANGFADPHEPGALVAHAREIDERGTTLDAFNVVCNAENWVLPISKTVAYPVDVNKNDFQRMVAAAVVYFTGSVPTIKESYYGTTILVTADGSEGS